MVLGSRATEPKILEKVCEVFEGFPSLQIEAAGEHIFASARGAAMFAHAGMEDGIDSCLPNPECPKLPDLVAAEDVKSEL